MYLEELELENDFENLPNQQLERYSNFALCFTQDKCLLVTASPQVAFQLLALPALNFFKEQFWTKQFVWQL